MARVVLVLLVLSSASTAMATPTLIEHLSLRAALMESVHPFAAQVERSLERPETEEGTFLVTENDAVDALTGRALGLSIAGWLLSASFYGVCLTAGVPELYASNPSMILEEVSRSIGVAPSLSVVVPPWAQDVARSIGLVTFSFGERSSSMMLLPIGPANTAGLSVAGCFN